ncbi:MAG TPA: hypothetical protein VFP36_14200 [Usitatibacter sp.]|nr:hypothetical protein [Usitatibacter sp.]
MRAATLGWMPAAALVAIAVLMAMHGPIAQPAGYHDFADTRTWLGVPRAADVLSNLPFAVVGAWGLWSMRRSRALPAAASAAYALFFVSLALTALGSGYYHLAPDDARLVWDRLPIAVACAALVAAVCAETRSGSYGVLAFWLVAAVGSVFWWAATADLRPYLLVQAAPLVLVPLWQWQAALPSPRRLAFALAIGLYVLAKVAEVLDRGIFQAAGMMSGHTLKHLLAALAAAVIASDLRRRCPAR